MSAERDVDLSGGALGERRLLRLLGRGGMGHVYEAVHEPTGRKAAVKVLDPAFGDRPDVVRRFFNEARAVDEIGHPNIVDVFECATSEEGLHYMAMELLEGAELRQEIQRVGAMPEERAIAIASQIADAIEAAHRRGIVHRDLKPENVYLVRQGGRTDFVKVLDFGVARLVAQREAETSTGTILGTPHYMAPEQTESPKVDGRADVYSLGIILYEMLTGKVPYPGKSAPAVLTAMWRGTPPPIRTVRPNLSPWLEAVTMKAFARYPADRYPSGAALKHALANRGAELGGAPAEIAGAPGEEEQTTAKAGLAAQARALAAEARAREAAAAAAPASPVAPAAPAAVPAPRKSALPIVLVLVLVVALAGAAAALWLGGFLE